MKVLPSIFQSSVVRNFSVLTGSNILVQALNIFSSIKIARCLLPDRYGIYSYTLSLIAIYVTFSSLGLRNFIIREVAIKRESSAQIFVNSIVSRSAAFLIVVVILISYNSFFSKIVFSPLIIFLICIQIITTVYWDSIESTAFGYERMKYSAIINLGSTVIWFLLILGMPPQYVTIESVLSVTVMIFIGKTAVYYIVTKSEKLFKGSGRVDFSHMLQNLKEALPFYFLALFTLVSTQLPVIYLEQLSTTNDIAFYNVANRIISPLQLLLMTLLTSLFPNFSRSYEFDKQKFSKILNVAFIVIFYTGVLGALFVTSFRTEIVNLLYGEKYNKSADIIAIQCWYTVLFALFCLIGTVMGAIKQQLLLSKLSFVYALISFPCLFYGAKFGALGLSIGFVIAAVINMTYHLYYLQKHIPDKLTSKLITIIGLSYVSFFVASMLLKYVPFAGKAIGFLIILSAFIYLAKKYRKRLSEYVLLKE